jgi:hypothetical protein
MKPQLLPFAHDVVARPPYERVDEEVYATIPALNEMASAALTVSGKLTHDARAALFQMDGADPALRKVAVELGVEHRFAAEGAAPDPEYLAGQEKATAQQYQTPDNDLWLDGPA